MKRAMYYIFMVLVFVLLAGCKKGGKSDNEGIINEYNGDKLPDSIDNITNAPKPTTSSNEDTPNPTDEGHEGEVRSNLTGLWIKEENAKLRPYAIQFSNFKTVRNQWGISQADIVYEALVEGGITRLMGIGENYTGERIGSVRSSRHYFVSIADEYDAIYIHYGKTKYAVTKLKKTGINNLDGETGSDSNVFYRDKTMKAPHNAFTSLERIQKGINKKGYRMEHTDDFKPHYSFYDEDTDLAGDTKATRVDIKFSSYNSPYFEYNTTDKLYYRYQFGAAHTDSNTGEQLAFKNIIVQYVKQWDIDKNDYQTMELEDAGGSGIYISNGSMVPISWRKKEADRFMRYYGSDGKELTINPGKTYVAVFPNNRQKDVVLK